MKAAVAAAQFESLGHLLSRHRAVTRVSLAALSFTILIAFNQQGPAQAGPTSVPATPESLLPQSIGAGIPTDAPVTISFDAAMDPATVADALQVIPEQGVRLSWNGDRTKATLRPDRLWRADERYLVVVSGATATQGGSTLRSAHRYTFTTQTAPTVAEFQVNVADADATLAANVTTDAMTLADRSVAIDGDPDANMERKADAAPIGSDAVKQAPNRTATEVSATSSISVGFSAVMNRRDVQEHFVIKPDIAGDLTWRGSNLVFTPSERLEPGSRYTISVVGAHDRIGNVLGGDTNFSFIVQPGAQLTKTSPKADAADVQPETVQLWFSQPMDVDATNEAFTLTDTVSGSLVSGILSWNEAGTQLTFIPDAPFAAGRGFVLAIGKGAHDQDGNKVTAKLSFSTPAAPAAPTIRTTVSTRSAPVVPPPAPASSMAGYALNQVNAARAAYGFAPVVLDSSISAVAYAHAYDQAVNNYFSHTGLDGSTRESRLRAGGVSFGWSGENACYLVGRSTQSTLDWCHAQFMAEPYPGQFNHIANVLNPNAKRLGVGIAIVGSKIVIVWDFTD